MAYEAEPEPSESLHRSPSPDSEPETFSSKLKVRKSMQWLGSRAAVLGIISDHQSSASRPFWKITIARKNIIFFNEFSIHFYKLVNSFLSLLLQWWTETVFQHVCGCFLFAMLVISVNVTVIPMLGCTWFRIRQERLSIWSEAGIQGILFKISWNDTSQFFKIILLNRLVHFTILQFRSS